jgi:uncharacterized RDD family membrane protein YckC
MSDIEEPEGTVRGIDNVPLELPIAGAGSRSLAAFLDYLVVGIATMLWGLACIGAAVALKAGVWMLAPFLIGFFLIDYGYFATLEILRDGQTLGKWALGLRVVTRDGARPGTSAILIRNAVRAVDLIVGVVLMATDPLARRLGDRLAGTLVVHREDARRDTVDVALARVPLGWPPHEVAVLESFLQRADSLDAARAASLAAHLVECIRHDDPALAALIDDSEGGVAGLRSAVLTAPA